MLIRSRLLGRDLLLAIAVFAGLALVVPNCDLGDRTAQGALWGTASGLTFALLTIWNRTLVRETPAIVVALWQNPWAAVALLPFARPLLHLSLSQALLLGLLGVFCTALAHWLFIDSLKTVRVQVASVTAGLEPVYGIVLAFILLGEHPDLREILGGIVILSAVTVVAWCERPAAGG